MTSEDASLIERIRDNWESDRVEDVKLVKVRDLRDSLRARRVESDTQFLDVYRNSTNSAYPTNPKTYFSIFAGRQRYLEILFRYLTKFLDEGVIDEVHL